MAYSSISVGHVKWHSPWPTTQPKPCAARQSIELVLKSSRKTTVEKPMVSTSAVKISSNLAMKKQLLFLSDTKNQDLLNMYLHLHYNPYIRVCTCKYEIYKRIYVCLCTYDKSEAISRNIFQVSISRPRCRWMPCMSTASKNMRGL